MRKIGLPVWLRWTGVCLLVVRLPVATFAETPAAGEASLTIVGWNVENLFDPVDDPDNPGDDDFTPQGWRRWTPERYGVKLERLAEIIAAMRPDILCLMEVENRRVLQDLARALRERHAWEMPAILHRDGPDRRGIDVAILARWEPTAIRWITPHPIQRDVLIARFEPHGRPLTVFCNHWKSNVGRADENTAIRTTEARAVRAEVAAMLAATPDAALISIGDFNDDVDSPILIHEAGFALYDGTSDSAATGVLHNLSGLLSVTHRATYYYSRRRVWNSFDSASVSRGMLPEAPHPAPWRVVTNAYGPFVLPQQRNADGHPMPFRRVRKRDADGVVRSANIMGYADHFPIRLELRAHAGAPPCRNRPRPTTTTCSAQQARLRRSRSN